MAPRSDASADNGVKPTGRPFVITRVFNAPRDLVWKAWTEAEHLQHWWGPKGCQLDVLKLDLRPGGIFHYAMRFSARAQMMGRFKYLEISPPQRLVYLSSFADETSAVIPAPFPGNFPLEVENTVTFEEHDGKTTLTIHGLPHNASDEQRVFFEGMFASMEGGFGGTCEQLSVYLERLRG